MTANLDDAFADLLQQVVDRHAVASRLRRTTALADEVLSDALRAGDGVRRAMRTGGQRPDAGDCAHLEQLARRLEEATDAALQQEDARALRRAAASGDAALAATLALTVFAGVERPAAMPTRLYLACAVRRRAREGEGREGEVLVHPETLARELVAASRDGVAPASGPTDAGDDGALPEPIALSPSFAGCGSEVALSRGTDDLRAALVEDTASGDLLIFTGRLTGPFGVAVAADADDEWWAASALRWPSYRAGLIEALESLGVMVETIGA